MFYSEEVKKEIEDVHYLDVHLTVADLLEILRTEMEKKLNNNIKVWTIEERKRIEKVIDSCKGYTLVKSNYYD